MYMEVLHQPFYVFSQFIYTTNILLCDYKVVFFLWNAISCVDVSLLITISTFYQRYWHFVTAKAQTVVDVLP